MDYNSKIMIFLSATKLDELALRGKEVSSRD